MAESTEINVVVSADVNGLISGMSEVKNATDKVTESAENAKKVISDSFSQTGTNSDLLKKNYNDITVEIKELNEKLRNEIALKKETATQTAKRIQDLTKEQKAIEKQAQAMTKSRSVIGSMTSALGKLGIAVGVAFAVRAVVNFAKEASKSYRESQAAERKLLAALNNRVEIQQRLLQQAKVLQSTTVFSDEAIINAQSFLAVQGRTEEQISKTIQAAIDLSAVTGEDLQSAVQKLDMTYEGSIGRLGRMEGSLKTLSKEQLVNGDAVKILGEKYSGMASAMAQTDEGKLKVLANRWDDLKEAIGEKFSAAVSGASDVLGTLIDGTKELISTDLSSKLEEEQMRVNVLTTALMDSNTTSEERNKIYKELSMIAPDVIKNIDIENVSTKILASNLAQYNKEMINKIVVTKAYEDAQKKANEAADDLIRIENTRKIVIATGLELQKEANKVGGVAADAINQTTKNYQSGAIGIYEYGRSLSNLTPLIFKLSDNQQKVKLLNDALIGSLQALNNAQEDSKVSTQESANALNAYQITAKNLGVQIGDVSTGQDAYNQKLQEEKDKLEASKKAQDEANKSKQDAKSRYQQLTEEISKLQELLQEQTLTGKGDIEATKQQIIQKTELKNRVDQLTEAFNEQLGLLTEINRIEPLQFDPQTDAETYYNEFARTLAMLAATGTAPQIKIDAQVPDIFGESNVITDAATKSGEDAGTSWIDGFLMSLGEMDEKQLNDLKGALSQAFDFAESTLIDSFTKGNEELSRQLQQRVNLISENVNSVEEELNREIELNKQGFASNVELKRKELEQLKIEQDKAIAERDKQIEKQRQQERTAATISATVGAIKLLSNAVETGGVAGLILGILAVGSFLASISSINSQAESAVKFADGTAQILGGNSHAGGGTSLGQFGEAEKGEFLGILSRSKSEKYGNGMMNLFDGINKSKEDHIAMGLNEIAMNSGMVNTDSINHSVTLNEVGDIKEIKQIMKQKPKEIHYMGNKRIEKQGNNTRIVYVN